HPAAEELDDISDAFNEAVASVAEEPETTFAAHAASFHETPITPELNATEIMQLEGIEHKRAKRVALRVPYVDMSEDTVSRIRQIVEEHLGEIPMAVTIVDLPPSLATYLNRDQFEMKINQHFRVQPSQDLKAKLQD